MNAPRALRRIPSFVSLFFAWLWSKLRTPIQKTWDAIRPHLKDCLEVAAVLIALGLLVVTACYTRYAKQQRDEMIKQTVIAQQTLRIQNRPWVGFERNEIAVEELPAQSWRISYAAKNYGLSPARRFIYRSTWVGQISSYSYGANPCGEEDKIASDPLQPASAIFPNEPPLKISETVRGDRKGWLKVCLVYHDVWGSKYDTSAFYSLEQSKVVSVETSQDERGMVK